MTDLNSMIQGMRKRDEERKAARKCKAIGCAKQTDQGHHFCLKHFNMLLREHRSRIWNGPPEARARGLEDAIEFIDQLENRGRG